jgi:hypothetical protein
MPNEKDQGMRSNQTVITAMRALGFGKMYLVIALVIGLGVLFFTNPTYISPANSGNSVPMPGIGNVHSAAQNGELPLLAVPFTVLPMMMLTTPMVILFVYDKNNGMLEYLLSLGMTQRNIYARYLKAALLVAFVYLLTFTTLNTLYSNYLFGPKFLPELATIFAIGFAIAISTVAFIITMMMAFSTLQKTRAGGNQPLAITLGIVGVLPGYVIPFVFSFNTALELEVLQAAIIAAVALILVGLSGKLVRREKFLP